MVAIQTIEHQDNIEPLRHYAVIHGTKFFNQPKNGDMGKVTNDFKRIGHTALYTTQELLEALSHGYCVILSNFEIDSKNSFRFVSSSAFTLDIDDDKEETNPIEVLNDLKDICAGLFYTFNHGKKGNRYRLFFNLDESLTDQDDLKALTEFMIDYLKGKGLPIDTGVKNPMQVIRPGIKGYEVNNFNVTLKVSELLPKAKSKVQKKQALLEARRKERKQSMNDGLFNPATFKELKDACEAIGYIPSGNGEDSRKKWLQIVYALKNEVITGVISDIEGFELYSIVSGVEASQSYWNNIKPRGEVKVGTVFLHAENAGYKRKHKYGYAQHETLEKVPQEVIKVDGYLTAEIAKTLIQRKQRLIVDSPTGSRKTTSFMNAFKELAKEESIYYLFICPTRSLTEQVGIKNNVNYVMGGETNIENFITTKAINGERIFVCTFDKACELVSYLSKGINYSGKRPQFVMVVDEIHKFTEAHNYRGRVIDDLDQMTTIATSFIGISGTCEDILKDNFDSLIKIDTGNNKSPCLEYRVFTYSPKTGKTYTNSKGNKVELNEKNIADVMLLPVIKGMLGRTKVLVFLNNKERIQRVAKLLKKEGISTQVVTSDDRRSPAYANIVKNEAIDNKAQVVLSTSVIADGVSINNGLNWSCLVVADKASPNFNPATIKQMSNRFRNNYRFFCLYMRELNPEYSDNKRFYIESAYQYRKKVVEDYVDYLNEEFMDEYLQEFTSSKIEKANGIYYRSTDENARIEYNPLFVRHRAMESKERYYNVYRQAFIEEVGRQLGIQCKMVVNLNELALNSEKGMEALTEPLEQLKEEQEKKKLNDIELRANFILFFDESIWNSFRRGDEESLRLFKQDVHPSQYRSMKRLCPIADFETCKTVGESIKKDADTHKYYNDIQALVEIATFDQTKKRNITKRVFVELEKVVEVTFTSKEFREYTEKELPKKLKVSETDVKAALKLFHKDAFKRGGKFYNTLQPLTIERVANLHNARLVDGKSIKLNTTSVRNSILKYVYTQNARQQPKLLDAIKVKYGIEKLEK